MNSSCRIQVHQICLMKKGAFTLTFNFMCIHDCSISTCFLWFREKLFFILKKRSTYYTNKIVKTYWGRSTVLIKYIQIRFQIKKRLYEDL